MINTIYHMNLYLNYSEAISCNVSIFVIKYLIRLLGSVDDILSSHSWRVAAVFFMSDNTDMSLSDKGLFNPGTR